MILTAGMRKRLPKSEFGMPGQRKYPMPDKAHARAALSRASQQLHRGNLSAAQAAHIREMANSILSGRKH